MEDRLQIVELNDLADEMPSIVRSRFPKGLIDVLAASEAIAVVGSGVSAAAGLPSWRKLLELLIQECEEHIIKFEDGVELKQLLDTGHYAEVADACSKSLRGPLYRDFIQRIFRPPQSKPTELHRHIFQLPFAGILTTNYDSLLEQEYVRLYKGLRAPPVFSQKNVANLAKLASEKEFFIFKAHGHVDDIDSIVLTQRDYQELQHLNPAYRSSVSTLFATKSLVFFGYGLRDPDLNLILGQQISIFRGFGKQHFAFIADAGKVQAELLAEQYGITVIPYSSKDNHTELFNLTSALVKQVRKKKDTQVTISQRLATNALSQHQRIREVMEFERRICDHFKGFIELERARFLQLYAKSLNFSAGDQALISKSITYWEAKQAEVGALQNQLWQAQKMESLGTLAGGIAHDFNNILGGILGHCGIAIHQIPKDHPALAMLAEVEQGCQRAKQLVRQILTFSRHREIPQEPLDIRPLITECSELLSSTISKKIGIVWNSPEKCRKIAANPTQISQVFLNLIINAAQAIDDKAGSIEIALFEEEINNDNSPAHIGLSAGNYLKITVEDTGPGIPEDILKRIFEPFFTTKSTGKGTGLGLSVVHGIVSSHRGKVNVESRIGVGTTFTIYLPAIESEEAHTNQSVEITINGNGRSILVIDDEPTVLRVSSYILSRLGFRVASFGNPVNALKAFQSNPDEYDLVLTDLTMPELNGLEVCKSIRSISPKTPVVLASGYQFDKVRARRAGIKEMIAKPFTEAEIASAVSRALE